VDASSSSISISTDIHQDTTRQPAVQLRRQTSPPILPSSELVTHPTSVVFVGNPGVGKSALLNALGGSFESGFSQVSGLTRQATAQDVELCGRPIRLVDMPGIYDSGKNNTGTFLSNLEMLQETLNNGDNYVVLFVISPRRGRIDPNDLALLKLFLDSIETGPQVGLILTQVRRANFDSVQNPAYTTAVYDLLRRADTKNMNLLDFAEETLVLCNHDEHIGFDQKEKDEIVNYVLSFIPGTIVVEDLFKAVVNQYFETLKQLMQS